MKEKHIKLVIALASCLVILLGIFFFMGKGQFYVVETVVAAPGKSEELKKELKKIVALSREEKGCNYYSLFQDREHPERLTVIMEWENSGYYDKHCNSEFIKNFEKQFEKVLYVEVIENLYRKIE